MRHLRELATTTTYNNSNCKSSRNKINPSKFPRSTSFTIPENEEISDKLLVPRPASSSPSVHCLRQVNSFGFSSLLRSLLKIIAFPTLIPAPCNFAVQDDPRSEPVFLLELAMSTASLVKEMSSGLVQIALEEEERVRSDKLVGLARAEHRAKRVGRSRSDSGGRRWRERWWKRR
ncbi:putative AGAMOUS-like 18 [Hibiscus syriacus]|uniref:AGAMOUS-like 18 n=1 Tax=Hibiscus syriacus TaxID=106335 RepID=A0A6A2XKW9_HIBSY|nr:putative AGAMOUS-like 18 [Hibiscus syriacus]